MRGTPIRDQLGLNEPSDSLSTPSVGGGAGSRAEMARLKAMREDLRHSLGALPAPENEIQVSRGCQLPFACCSSGSCHHTLSPAYCLTLHRGCCQSTIDLRAYLYSCLPGHSLTHSLHACTRTGGRA